MTKAIVPSNNLTEDTMQIKILHNVALVCHNWRDITSRSGFIPWRKLYFQFKIYHESGMKRIEYLLIEHQEILSSSIHAQIYQTFLPWILEFVSLEFHSASFIEIQHVRNYNFIKEKLADRFELLDVASHNANYIIV
ncbi:FBXO18 [Lepeophtheirus salmonis]|uniref:FBXO18 n=1 Tax=Lepeophtheirus salmonis TaxID=72036 RepID=A0A7R8D1N8_LEPSM|nr:FBXO18 [Lepeophtheirus salmonis]CAF2997132.1 FBXO18 [Lepeophtheirus salmonis]